MTKQKRGFWLFIFSLIPGAGEMYMGFRRQGISIMFLFWGIIAIASGTSLDWLIMFLPILWFYSFFNVHNLKSLSEEEFYSIEDEYILHFDQMIGNADNLVSKYRTIVAVLLIFFGVAILWSNFTDLLFWVLPSPLAGLVRDLSYRLPELVIALAIIVAGFYILSHKKAQLDNDYKNTEEEHYWEPYRPYQQNPAPEQTTSSSKQNWDNPGSAPQNNTPDYQPPANSQILSEPEESSNISEPELKL